MNSEEFKKKREWIWEEEVCHKCLAKKKYDEKTNTLTCPRCGGVSKFTYSESVEKTNRMFFTLRDVIYGFPPHKYLYEGLSAEEIAGMFLRKLDKRDWNIWLSHDYVLAKLRRDGERQERMREAVRTMATRMDYDVDDCMALFPDILDPLEKSADLIPHTLYDIAERHFRVDGWRTREDEMVYEGNERRAGYPKIVGKDAFYAFNLEEHLWKRYYDAIYDRYFAYRVEGDRVACWVTRELMAKVYYVLRGPEGDRLSTFELDADPYPDDLVEDVIEGRGKPDLQETAVQWFLKQANQGMKIPDERLESLGYHVEEYDYIPDLVVEEAVFAVATRLGWKTIPFKPLEYFGGDGAKEYAQKLAEKFNDPEIQSLSEKAWAVNVPEEERVKAADALLTKVKVILSALPPVKKRENNSTMYV